MNPFLAQRIALRVVFITLIMLLRMGDLRWLQRRGAAEPDRPREAQRQRRASRVPSRFPPSFIPPSR